MVKHYHTELYGPQKKQALKDGLVWLTNYELILYVKLRGKLRLRLSRCTK